MQSTQFSLTPTNVSACILVKCSLSQLYIFHSSCTHIVLLLQSVLCSFFVWQLHCKLLCDAARLLPFFLYVLVRGAAAQRKSDEHVLFARATHRSLFFFVRVNPACISILRTLLSLCTSCMCLNNIRIE